jgi:glycosyltransferase involved in cell wall biosynthesis
MADDEPWWKRFITRLTSKNKDRLIASSGAVKQSLINYVKVPEDKIEVIYNGVDFSKLDGISHSPSPLDRPVIGTLTRLHPDKGNQYFVEAFSRVVKKYPDAQCWIIGEGEERAKLEAMSRHQGLQDRIKFWGRVKEPFPLLAQMNVFVFPSITEALGIALIEAAGLGVPAIASDVGGIPEVLEGRPDWLVPPRQPGALADKIIEVLQNYLEAKDNAQQLSKSIRKRFDAVELAAEQAELYRRLVEGRA